MKRVLGVQILSGQEIPADLVVEDQSTTAIQTFRLSSLSKQRKAIISKCRWQRKYDCAYFFGLSAVKAAVVHSKLKRATAVDRALYFLVKGNA